MCAWEFPTYLQQLPWWVWVAAEKARTRVERTTSAWAVQCSLAHLGLIGGGLVLRGLMGWCGWISHWVLPLSAFKPVLSQTKLPTSSLKLSWEGSFGGLLSNFLLKAELTSTLDQVTQDLAASNFGNLPGRWFFSLPWHLSSAATPSLWKKYLFFFSNQTF